MIKADSYAQQYLQQGIAEGRAKGVAEGLQQGLQQGLEQGSLATLRNAIMGFIARLFPEASEAEAREKLDSMDRRADLEFILNRAFDWKSYQDVWTLPESKNK